MVTPLPTTRPHYAPGRLAIYQQMAELAGATASINFAKGAPEPVYDDLWTDALRAHLGAGSYQYGPTLGLPELREAVARLHDVDADDVIITSGCSESVVAALQALSVDGRRQVMWNEPFFITFMGMAASAQVDGVSVPLKDTGERFEFAIDAIDAHLTANPGGIWILNTPHNPTGAVIDEAQWPHLLEVAERTDTLIVFDDAYRDFRFDGNPAPYRALLDSGRVIVAGSISKTLAASGLRVGWMLAPKQLRGAADDFHAAMTYCVPAFVQKATVDVLARVAGPVMEATTAAYARRVDQLVATLTQVGADVRRPRGGFFLVAALPTALTGHFDDGMDLVRHLAHTHKISPLPLDMAFSEPTSVHWLRWTTSLPDADLDEGCRRLLAAAGIA